MYVTTWIYLKIHLLNKLSQLQKEYIFYNSIYANFLVFKKGKFKNRERRLVAASGWAVGGEMWIICTGSMEVWGMMKKF